MTEAENESRPWRCAGCGSTARGLVKTCNCPTMVGHRDGESTWLISAEGEGLILTNAQIKHMVDRFLSWKLPANFSPDHGISYTNPYPNIPSLPGPMGTNLFDAVQAEAMVRFMAEGLQFGEPPVDAAFPQQVAIMVEKLRGHATFAEGERVSVPVASIRAAAEALEALLLVVWRESR